MYPTAQPVSITSTPRLHLPDVVRGIMLLVAVGVLAKLTLLNDHLIFGPVAWIVFLGSTGLALAGAARIVFIDAPDSRAAYVRVERTRQSGVFSELVMAGAGGIMLLVPAMFATMATSQEVWAGRVEPSNTSLIGLVPTLLIGLAGFFMTFWRPQFVVDTAARKIVRHPFGRSIPVRAKELPYDLAVYSDGYFITNTGQRLGDMIRGRVGRYTFELEMLRGNLPPHIIQARAMGWASALGARYMTPEQAAAQELRGGS